jgi:hypothetical protein
MQINQMVRGKNIKPVNRYLDSTKALTDTLVIVDMLDGQVVAKNGAGDRYEGREEDFLPVTPNLINYHYNDVDIQRANACHNGTSWTPERRGYLYAEGYCVEMEELDEYFSKLVNDDNRPTLVAALETYRKKYLSLMWCYLNSHANLMSSAISGPSNFPVRRAEKLSRWAGNHLDTWVKWQKKSRERLDKQFNPKHSHVISSDDKDVLDKLRQKIDTLERVQERMKAANAICRGKKKTDEQKADELKAQGFTDDAIYSMLHPRYTYEKQGFQTYKLTNNNAEIRRLKGRLAELERKAKDVTKEETFGDVTIKDSVEDNRVQIFFPGKPSAAVITYLKKHGFRFAFSKGAWQRHRSADALEYAKEAVKIS